MSWNKTRVTKTCAATVALSLLCNCLVLSGLLQSIGWMYMFASYMEDCSAAESLQRTFSGEDPCGFCDASAALAGCATGNEHMVPSPPLVDTEYTPSGVACLRPVDRGPGMRLPGYPLLYAFSCARYQASPS